MTSLDLEKFKSRLKQPLPGVEAQMQLMPRLTDSSRFDLSRREHSIPGGVLILLYPIDGKLYIPMMLRPEYGGAHSGQVSFPGGKKEPEDADLVQTALRESFEELGIPAGDVTVLGKLTELFIIASNFTVLPVIGYMDPKPDFIPDPREVVELIETPVSHLLKPDIIKEGDFPVREGITIRAPFYDIKGHRVWGATAMILREFLTVYKDL